MGLGETAKAAQPTFGTRATTGREMDSAREFLGQGTRDAFAGL